jgi:RHS repeat-associated protein
MLSGGVSTFKHSDRAGTHCFTLPRFEYNDLGHRVAKHSYHPTTYQLTQSTFYLRDPSGRLLSVYQKTGTNPAYEKERYLYGMDMIGVMQMDASAQQPGNGEEQCEGCPPPPPPLSVGLGCTGQRMYYLKDQVGNVRVILLRGTTAGTPPLAFQNYYPFGMSHPGGLTSSFTQRFGYQGEYAEQDPETKLAAFEARMYDAVTGRWLAVDPQHQYHSPYLAMGNNPMMMVDPDGEFVFAFPTVSYSKNGGLSIGFVAGVGIPGLGSAQIGGGYNFQSNEGYAFVAATVAFNTVSLSYSPSGGWNTSYTLGLSPYSGVPVSSNAFTVGVNYNLDRGYVSGNISAWEFDQKGNFTFNPSVSAVVMPEHSTNFVRGQGFRSNDKVLARFVSNNNHQGAIDYFGMDGVYEEGGDQSSARRNKETGKWEIVYRENVFDTYGDLLSTFVKESFTIKRANQGRLELADTDYYSAARQPEERLGVIQQYKLEGYYRKIPGFFKRIKFVEQQINFYNEGFYNTTYNYTPYQAKWWHPVYRIHRIY